MNSKKEDKKFKKKKKSNPLLLLKQRLLWMILPNTAEEVYITLDRKEHQNNGRWTHQDTFMQTCEKLKLI